MYKSAGDFYGNWLHQTVNSVTIKFAYAEHRYALLGNVGKSASVFHYLDFLSNWCSICDISFSFGYM